jgi:hypothetical protein
MEKIVKDGQPLTEWTCSCGHVQQLKVKSLLEIEEHIDYLHTLYEKAITAKDVEYQKSVETRISALQWVIGWYDNTH